MMSNPHGLGYDEMDNLFVCDGENGLRVYSITDPVNLVQEHHFTGHSTFDVITNGTIIMVIGPDGLYQYNYDEGTQLTLLSMIPVMN
ncbi:MAG: hypothetical protein IH946_04770 [Bacteroidetes bacterium]|nr:hypothetical protein [Bacteroidota bacterium]